MKFISETHPIILTAGSAYLDIDAYACMAAMSELLKLKGEKAIAYSNAPSNYSVCKSLIKEEQIYKNLPSDFQKEAAKYIIVDVSDPEFIKDAVPLNNIIEVYDHHVGFEQYWSDRIGDNSHIEFIGAAATLIYREWKKSNLQDKMTRSTALLLIAAILDNTLNLTSSNTTQEDKEVFNELCEKADVDENWCADYFSEVQENVEADLRNALFGDIKRISDNDVLPPRMAQLCVWNADSIIEKLAIIRKWFNEADTAWMINIIDIHRCCSYFVCDNKYHQKEIGRIFDICFEAGVAKTPVSYLRKEIIKKIYFNTKPGGKKMIELGFIHGRFQLFHNDHLNYALLAKGQCKKLIVGITSPENASLIREEVDPHRSEAASNPFTYYERYNMVKLALLEAGVKREDFEIVPYPIERPDILYNYVPLSATSFFTIYDKWGYEKLNRLKSLGYGTVVLFDDREKKMCSTEIRQKIVDGDSWKDMVPEAVYQYIIENDLTSKVMQLMQKD